MPQSYSAIWVHLIWSTKNREAILTPPLRRVLFDVLRQIADDHEIRLDCVNGIEDHIHLLVRLRTDQQVSEVVKTLKGNSWEFFREKSADYLTWQDGYAAFSVSPDNLQRVRYYIRNQEKHHQKVAFSEEMKNIKAAIKIVEDE